MAHALPKSSITHCHSKQEANHGKSPSSLAYLLLSWTVLRWCWWRCSFYRAVLANREDDQIYLNKAEVSMMAGEQQVLIGRLQRLARPITWLSVLSVCC